MTATAVLAALLFTGVMGPTTPDGAGQLFMLRVHDGAGDERVYTGYRTSGSNGLFVQRSLFASPDHSRRGVSADSCEPLRDAVAALERTPWPSIRLEPGPRRSYVERDRRIGYTFHGRLGFTDAVGWESTLFVSHEVGAPPPPFAAWAGELVRVVDTCLARSG
jgi:hypothetical protein